MSCGRIAGNCFEPVYKKLKIKMGENPINKENSETEVVPKKVQLIEINTVPGLTETSLVPKSATLEGIDFNELVLRILNTACFKE